jgi:hypothetical protein
MTLAGEHLAEGIRDVDHLDGCGVDPAAVSVLSTTSAVRSAKS